MFAVRSGGEGTSLLVKAKRHLLPLLVFLLSFPFFVYSEQSVARKWNEAHLNAIRRDLARPTVNARTLFHCAMAMYDAWAVYDTVAQPFLLGKTVGGYSCPFIGISSPPDVHAAREEAISYAAYRLLKHRFKTSPGATPSLSEFDSLLTTLGYDTAFTSTDYSTGSPAALGNYIAQSIISFGLQDNSNEQNNYAYQHFIPYNPALTVAKPGNPEMVDPNRWQPLTLDTYIDQNGHVYPGSTPKCLTPEWGGIIPFALTTADRVIHNRDGTDWCVYDDPGPPATLDTMNSNGELTQAYRWAFALVAVWSSHLKPNDTLMRDISPASIGNNQVLPQTLSDLINFYNLTNGGDYGGGHTLNPRTGQPYIPQFVPRGDYTRVLTEFWADGPSSETPPGHWFTILNYVSDHPAFVKKFRGQGSVIDDLEWDVKSYFALGGAVHDAAIAAWGIKGWYDYVRPISAIRWMADHGQCTDSTLPQYSPAGIPLIPGFIELVQLGDPLVGTTNQNLYKIKLYAWRGTKYITNPSIGYADVGWILAENWVPYQRPTFVTPPFQGYISGHSTYSRAAAEVLTLLTGDEYFPGGMGEFHAARNRFLGVENGPSIDVALQWATYRDASDQCSLSRIWGGIHPPVDDMPGRIIGKKIGVNSFLLAEEYFSGTVSAISDVHSTRPTDFGFSQNYPNPFNPASIIRFALPTASTVTLRIYNILGQEVQRLVEHAIIEAGTHEEIFNATQLASGVYIYRIEATSRADSRKSFTQVKKMILLK